MKLTFEYQGLDVVATMQRLFDGVWIVDVLQVYSGSTDIANLLKDTTIDKIHSVAEEQAKYNEYKFL